MRRIVKRASLIVMAFVLAMGTSGPAPTASATGEACPTPFTVYDAPPTTGVQDTIKGGDGAMWYHGSHKIGYVASSGALTEVATSPGRVGGMSEGPNGSTWISGNNNNGSTFIASVTPNGLSAPITLDSTLWRVGSLTKDANGTLWIAGMTDNGAVLMEKPISGAIVKHTLQTENYTGIRNSSVQSMTIDPDGALWLLLQSGNSGESNRIGRFDTQAETLTWLSLGAGTMGGYLEEIVYGPDDALWFTGQKDGAFIGRMSTTGQVTIHREGLIEGGFTAGLTVDPNGYLWFTNDSTIGRISPIPYKVELFGTQTGLVNPYPIDITSGSDAALWISNLQANSVSKLPLNAVPQVATPVNLAQVGNDIHTPTFTWDATEAATNYKICRNGVVAAETANTSFNDATVPNGEYFYTIIAENSQGKFSAVSLGAYVPVDRQVPILETPALTSNFITFGQETHLTANATDDSGIQAIYYKVNDSSWVSMTPPGGIFGDPEKYHALFRWQAPGGIGGPQPNILTSKGVYTITVKAVDSYGRESATQTLELTAGIHPPANISAPGATTGTPQLSWEASEGASYYNIYRNTDEEPIASVDTLSYEDASALSEGAYSYTVSAVAGDNSESEKSQPVTVKVDRTAPTVSNLAVTPGFILFFGNLNISANATDAVSGIARAEYFIDTDPGQGNATPMTVNTSGTVSASKNIAFGSLSRGTHSVKVRVQDSAGNWSTILSRKFTYF